MSLKYSITFSEKKNPDWIVADLKNEAGIEYKNVSINRTKKSTGEVFPGFDEIMTGHTISGEFWETPDRSKAYLYPPRVDKPYSGANKSFGGGIKAVERKEAGIEKAQVNKAEGIMTSSTIRMAVDCAIAEFNNIPETGELESLILKWRAWFVDKWEITPTDKKAFQ